MKNLDIQIGDRVTYIKVLDHLEFKGNLFSTREIKENRIDIIINNENIINDRDEILKIERIGTNGWYTVYEKKEEILDEKEKTYLNAVIKPFKKYIKIFVFTMDMKR